jgi:plasmid stabilization system protein ParE
MVRESKRVITSRYYEEHLVEILEYGIAKFGYTQVKKYFNRISSLVERLETEYTYYPECRYLQTKSRMYRNIILDAHLIIYRITEKRIEVLDIIHSASSIRKIRNIRKICL